MEQFGRIVAYVYAGEYGDTPDNGVSRSIHPDWTLCAFLEGNMVASYATLPLTFQINGRPVEMGGISGVGTLPEYRRRGLFRKLVYNGLQISKERGQYIVGCWPSQASLWQRFGFSIATQGVSYNLDPRDIRFTTTLAPSGSIKRYDFDSSFSVINNLYRDFIENKSGYLFRSSAIWHNNALKCNLPEGPVHIAIYEDEDGVRQGYLIYTTRFDKISDHARPQGMTLRELVWLTPEAYKNIWIFIAQHGLVGRITYPNAPSDDPAPEYLEEPRMLYPKTVEGLWARITDVRGALENRRYSFAGHIVVKVWGDEIINENNDSFRLETDGHETEVARTDLAPDITLNIKSLASLYTGFRKAHELTKWGLLDGASHGVRLADRLFETEHVPFLPDRF